MATLDFDKKVKGLENAIQNTEDISQKNKKLILDFKRDLSLDGMSKAWQQNILSRLKIMAQEADFHFDEATEDDLKDLIEIIQQRDIAERTLVDYKKVLKRFYKWLNGGEHPQKVSWVTTTDKTKNHTLPEDVLTEEDIRKLLENCKTARDKALISLLWETGARIGELIDLKVEDLRDYDHGYQIVIDGKTGSRRLPLISSVPHLRNWLNNHPDPENGSPLWAKIRGKNAGERVGYRYILKMLKETKKRAGLEKPLNPHHFRHSRATYLASKFKEAQMCEWFGWVQGSDVPGKYVHMSGRDIDDSYERLHGIQKEEKTEESDMAPIECPRCREMNDPEASFCYQCGQALSTEAAQDIEKEQEEISKDFTQLAKENPELLDEMDEFMDMLKLMKENKEVMQEFKRALSTKKE
ncbi:MAG: tyrosine-type recombinase/integrase [Thermoplasmatota archaeon]